ncbi:hypothetical protein G7Y79_00029g063220 [Physcia stellaris]|nr:hypothetical protein G7Y79_00029g063220 [Physcia stellaris]
MQLTILTIILLLPLTLSAPTTPLTKRAHYGWVGSSNSTTCSSDAYLVGPRPKLNDVACHPFVPATNTLAISFGSWPLGFGALDVFSDEGCTVRIDTIRAPEGCVDVRERGVGGMRSMRNAD